MCTIKKEKKKEKEKNQNEPTRLKWPRRPELSGALSRVRLGPGSGAPGPPASRRLGWAWEFAPRCPHHPARATGAWLGAGSSLKLFSFLVFLFK